MKTTLWNGPTFVAVALVAAGVIASTQAQAGNNCKSYALQSAKQQKTNEEKSCGFTGPEWSKNIKDHESWCASVPPQKWRQMLQDRQKKLQSCG